MVSTLVSSVRGILEGVGPDWADVDIGGITLRVSAPDSTLRSIGAAGSQVRLLTSLQVREDNLTLFGFGTEEERSIFEALISISGVGPRLALGVLSRLSPESLAAAVHAGDTNAIATVHGVGRKTAGRIVLELKGKLPEDWSSAQPSYQDDDVLDALTSLGYSAIEVRNVGSAKLSGRRPDALTSLGYSAIEVRKAVAEITDGASLTTEEKVRRVLERMAGD